jgi:hypothetical protein
MYSHNGTLYPMLGVGAFMTMFWTGIVVGHELGLGCATLLIMGLLSGCIATVGVCELQRRDGHGLTAAPGERATGRVRSEASREVRRPGKPGRSMPLPGALLSARPPIGPTTQS